MTENQINIIKSVIESRALKNMHALKPLLDKMNPFKDFHFWIAGGCLSGGEVRDIDIFLPPTQVELTFDLPVVSQTKNSTTYKYSPPIQICKYRKDSLGDLITSFDFAHIQVGAHIVWTQETKSFVVVGTFFTEEFVTSNAIHSTWFTYSDYPLSSLIRAGKYYRQRVMPKSAYLRCILSTLTAVLQRGFKDYDDFKDQLDSVDLGLLPEELNEVENAELLALYDLLHQF